MTSSLSHSTRVGWQWLLLSVCMSQWARAKERDFVYIYTLNTRRIVKALNHYIFHKEDILQKIVKNQIRKNACVKIFKF